MKEKTEINITEETIIAYEDLEIKYNSKMNQFYFLIIDFDNHDDLIYYDSINGRLISKQELRGYKHYDKRTILKEDREYSSEELNQLYEIANLAAKEMKEQDVEAEEERQTEKKEEPSQKKNKESTQKVNEEPIEPFKIDESSKFFYDELEVKYNETSGNFFFIVKTPGYYGNGEFYDAVTGAPIERNDLVGYTNYNKGAIFDKEQQYSPKEIEALNNIMNETKVNYSFGGNSKKR